MNGEGPARRAWQIDPKIRLAGANDIGPAVAADSGCRARVARIMRSKVFAQQHGCGGRHAPPPREGAIVRKLRVSLLVIALVVNARALPESSKPDTSKSMLNPGAFTEAEICAGCHKDIHAGWSGSMHATSYTDPVFREALDRVVSSQGQADLRPQCLSCHAPTTLVTKDFSGAGALTREGITCSFCHSIVGAKPTWGMDAFTLEPGQTMRGPFQFASSPGHQTEYSPLHRTALMCAPCHQFSSSSGVAVLNTYEEWKGGPWPSRGVQCQDCHMALVRGAVAETILKPAQISAQDRRLVNLHRLVGGSSLGQLRRALTATIRETKREGGSIKAIVEVTNDAAGHRAPTGLPSRSIVLQLEASSRGARFHSDERVYRRDLLDDAGKMILSDSDAFLRSARTGNDTRIAPGEKRIETFTFACPPGSAKLVVGLDYIVRVGPGAPRRRERFQELTLEVP